MMKLESPLTVLKGIGEKTAQNFSKAGIETLEDLIGYYPRAYEAFEEPVDIETLADGQMRAVNGCIDRPLSVRYLGKISGDHRKNPGWSQVSFCYMV